MYLVQSQNSKAHYRILLFQAVLKMLSYTLLPCTKVILSVLQRNLWTISVNLSTALWLWASPKLSTADKSGEKTWWNENLAGSIIIFLSHPPGSNPKSTQVFAHRKCHSNSWKHGGLNNNPHCKLGVLWKCRHFELLALNYLNTATELILQVVPSTQNGTLLSAAVSK